MTLTPGARIGAFEILSALGAGGMGEVYRGRDSRLARDVAIKILPAELSSNEDRLRRFEQEARAASALNHPNIITIYEIGSTDSTAFIAMEFVDGKTLRELLHAGPLPPRRALHIASQIAEGLGKAHEAGIVHRDLKPENIMVTGDGYVKILDFGLAKLVLQPSGEEVSVLPTSAGTDAGVVLGTVGYMSPEQASAGVVDFRSDQFSFGAILYEMVTGKRAFQKKTSIETLAAIINQDPEPIQSSSVPVAPPIRWIIDQCLEKDPKNRYAATRDLARDLQNVRDHFSELSSSTQTIAEVKHAVPVRRRLHKLWDIAAVVLIVLLASALIFNRRVSSKEKPERVSNHRLTYRRGTIDSARFSPDGQTIVYNAKWEGRPSDLFITRPDAIESRSLGIPDAEIWSISSSGEMLLGLKKGNDRFVLAQAPLTGGTPREIVDNVRAADWAPDGSKIAVARHDQGKTILEYPSGHPIYESQLDLGPIRISPDGNHIALMEHDVDAINGRVIVIDLKGKIVTDSGELYPSGISWAHSGKEVFFTNLSSDPGGGIELMAMNLEGTTRFIAPFSWCSIFDVSRDQRLLMKIDDRRQMAVAYKQGDSREVNLTWLDQSEVADLSSDSKKVLIHERGEGSESPSGTIYLVNSDGTSGLRLAGGNPVEFSPDGKTVLAGVGAKDIILVPVGPGSTKTFQLFRESQRVVPAGFLPDGRLVVNLDNPDMAIAIYDVKSGKSTKILDNFSALRRKKVSPDGKSLLVMSRDSHYFILSLQDSKTQPVPSLEPEEEPLQWSADGRSIYTVTRYTIPVKIFKIEISTGKRQLFREILPADPAGIIDIRQVRIADDEQMIAYSHNRVFSTLYSIKGLN